MKRMRTAAVMVLGLLMSSVLVVPASHGASVDTEGSSWLASDFNASGIGDLGANNADLDGGGYYLLRDEMSAAGVPANQPLTVPQSGLTYVMGGGTPGATDHIRANGQRVDTSVALGSHAAQPATKIQLIGMAVQSDQQNVPLGLVFENSTQQVSFSLTDWCSAEAKYDNVIIGTHKNRYQGSSQSSAVCGLFATSEITIPAGETLEALQFPTNSNVRIFAVASDADTKNAVLDVEGPVTISGQGQVGVPLRAVVGQLDAESTVKYRWWRNGDELSAFTGDEYTPTGWDAGAQISVSAVVTRSGHQPAALAQSASVTIESGTLTQLSAPTFAGTAQVGESVIAIAGSYAQTPTSTSYQWLIAGQPVSGATGISFVPDVQYAGAPLSVQITTTARGYDPVIAEVRVGTIAKRTMAAVQEPYISGANVVGERLQVTDGVYSAPGVSSSYQWLQNGQAIAGQTTKSYTVQQADLGTRVGVRITVTAPGYEEITQQLVTSVVVAPAGIGARSAPSTRLTVTKAPQLRLSGKKVSKKSKVRVGDRIKVRKPAVNVKNARMTYQWFRQGKKIRGATKSTYVISRSDRGKKIRVKVKIKADGYNTEAIQVEPIIKVRRS